MTVLEKFREVFDYPCPSCNAPYRTIAENGNSKFLHKGLTSTKDKAKLPTSRCVPYHDYVVFKPCGHCCPDVFDECRACKLGHPGTINRISRPTIEECYCHYCHAETASDEDSVQDQVQVKNDKKIKQGAVKIFISYAHSDETFKNELVIMLAGLQRRGIIDAWQDRRIEAGAEWLSEIRRAMDECRIAVLLMSPDFIASRFIQDKELTRLLQRRKNEGLRVIPIIIRPCLWKSEPVIKDLQALPKDGKPVITFSLENGDRDQVWADIGEVIENRVASL